MEELAPICEDAVDICAAERFAQGLQVKHGEVYICSKNCPGTYEQRFTLRKYCYTFGSKPENDIIVRRKNVADCHCRLEIEPPLSQGYLVNLCKENPTMLNQCEVQMRLRVPLNDGDMISVGYRSFLYHDRRFLLKRLHSIDSRKSDPSSRLKAGFLATAIEEYRKMRETAERRPSIYCTVCGTTAPSSSLGRTYHCPECRMTSRSNRPPTPFVGRAPTPSLRSAPLVEPLPSSAPVSAPVQSFKRLSIPRLPPTTQRLEHLPCGACGARLAPFRRGRGPSSKLVCRACGEVLDSAPTPLVSLALSRRLTSREPRQHSRARPTYTFESIPEGPAGDDICRFMHRKHRPIIPSFQTVEKRPDLVEQAPGPCLLMPAARYPDAAVRLYKLLGEIPEGTNDGNVSQGLEQPELCLATKPASNKLSF